MAILPDTNAFSDSAYNCFAKLLLFKVVFQHKLRKNTQQFWIVTSDFLCVS